MIRKVAQGKASLQAAFRAAWEEARGLPEGDYEIVVRKREAPGSPEQLALIHAILARVADATGNDMDQLKDLVKRRFLAPVNIGGKIERPSLSAASKRERSLFIEKLVAWAVQDAEVYVADLLEGHRPPKPKRKKNATHQRPAAQPSGPAEPG